MSYTLNTNTGIITRNLDNVVVSPAQSDTDPNYLEYIDWVSQGNSPTIVSVDIIPSRHITKLAFRNRFTSVEKVMLEMACLDNPLAPMASRQLAASLRVYLKDVDNATFIDLDRLDTRNGVLALAQFELLTIDRANAILDDPIQPHEQYRE